MASINRKYRDDDEYKALAEAEDKRPVNMDRIQEILASRPDYSSMRPADYDHSKAITDNVIEMKWNEWKDNLSKGNTHLNEDGTLSNPNDKYAGIKNALDYMKVDGNLLKPDGTLWADAEPSKADTDDSKKAEDGEPPKANDSKASADDSKKAESENVDADGNGTLPYQPSDMVSQYQAKLDELIANAPSKFDGGTFQQKVQEAMDKILNREQFSYDMNADAMYQQYKDNYINQGKLAMQDAIGQASAMTGGYGNSYAAQVGNQAYQQNLQRLNDVVPELYQLAQNRYNMEGQNLLQNYQMAQDQYNQAYNEYRDNVSDYNRNLQNAYNMLANERDYDRTMRNDAFNQNMSIANMLNSATTSSKKISDYISDSEINKLTEAYEKTRNDALLRDSISARIDDEELAYQLYDRITSLVGLGNDFESNDELEEYVRQELRKKVQSGKATDEEINALNDNFAFINYLAKYYGK